MIHLLPAPPRLRVNQFLLPGHIIFAVALYSVLTLAATWPLTTALGRRIIGDLGDPLFVTWVMTWVMSHLARAVRGDLTALDELWQANIFYPERHTLAFSEHFIGPSLQMLPLWSLTGNSLLTYNVAVLSTFLLTALGTYLLTRSLTRGIAAPLLAGTIAAFNPYRLELEISHLHVLSIQWLPLALVSLRRYIGSGSAGWLTAAAACVVALNLSSVYFMLFCVPFLVLFVLADLRAQGRLLDPGRWAGLGLAAVCVALVSVPVALQYTIVQRDLGMQRSLAEVRAYSASLGQYAQFFLPWSGVPLLFATLALVSAFLSKPPASRVLIFVMLGCVGLAFVLSLGPILPWGMRGPYYWLYAYAPGFNGLRAVGRYGALFLIFIAVSAGIGAAWISRVRLLGPLVVSAATALFLWQVWPAATPLNAPLPSAGLRSPPAYLDPAPTLPRIYQAVQGLDPDAVLAEFPFGDPWYDIRYMFFSATHQRRLMNGYSGVFPASYVRRQRVLAHPLEARGAALEALAGATHVIVHRAAWSDDTGARIVGWFESEGAAPVYDSGEAALLALDALERNAQGRDWD